MEKAQKVTVQHNGKTIGLLGTFANGLPTGELTLSVDDTTVVV